MFEIHVDSMQANASWHFIIVLSMKKWIIVVDMKYKSF